MSDERVVRVLPDVAAVSKSFDYTVPAALSGRVRVGTQVRIKLNGRRVGGWVVEDGVDPPPGVKLSPLESVRGWGPPPEIVEIARWAAWRWAGPVSALLNSASPRRVVGALPDPDRSSSSLQVHSPQRPAQPSRALSGGTVVVRLPPAASFLAVASEASGFVEREDARLSDARAEGGSRSGSSEAAGVLLLAPSHDAGAQLAGALRAGGRRVALLPEDWADARAGGCSVVGARNAAFAPLPRLLAAVVFDAHDEAYHEERAPTWCAWEVVAERAKRDGAPCALVSPCPTLDLLGAGPLIVPARRDEREGWSVVEVLDRRRDDPRTGLFSERVVSVLRWAREVPGRRVLCVLNRTGRVRLMACASCAEIARCETCSGPLELVKEADWPEMRCRRCGERRPVVCARCGGRTMRALRLGVTRVREELEALAGTEVEEVWGKPDPSHVRAKPGAGPPIAVGTEALLHRSPSADVVIFLDFDSELLAPRMRASEEALALLARASRLVGGSQETPGRSSRTGGRVIVQTRIPSHEVIESAVSADPGRLASSETPLRSALGLPPFSAMAVVSGAAADQYGRSLREAAPPGVEVSGPTEGKWSLRAPGHEELCDLLAEVPRPRGRLRVEVDPVRA